jgi:glycosyltransferase involved in cell wall biosynthesis
MIDPREGPPAAPPRAGRPALSVVVPAGDALRTIAPCLEGLLRNLGPADELLVADAGGADGTREYAELLASEQDGRMRVLPASPGGPAALRAGLAAATHPIALLLHPGLGAPDGFVDGVTQLLAAQAGDVVIALPTGGGVCAAGSLDTLRRLSEASADAFFAPDLAPIGDAALATGTRVASVT